VVSVARGATSGRVPSSRGLVPALGRVSSSPFVLLFPIAVFVLVLVREYDSGDVAVDFHNELYPEAQLVVDGRNPFPPAHSDLSAGANRVFPIPAALLAAPFTLVSRGAADAAFTGFVVLCLAATLYVLRVRDWRAYGLVLLWPPVISAVQTANLTLTLGLLCALAWTHRDNKLLPGVFIGLALALKFFLWPLTVWLLATRRFASATVAVSITAVSLLLVLPFTSISGYVSLVDRLSDTVDEKGYTLYALLYELGVSATVGKIVWFVVGLTVLLAGRRSFSICVIAALLLSPIVWLHFFALLVVPLAIAGAPLWAWAIPLLMWLVPGTGNGLPWQTALVLAATGAILLVVSAARPRASPAAA
jgi:glycosyl transferase family 87